MKMVTRLLNYPAWDSGLEVNHSYHGRDTGLIPLGMVSTRHGRFGPKVGQIGPQIGPILDFFRSDFSTFASMIVKSETSTS